MKDITDVTSGRNILHKVGKDSYVSLENEKQIKCHPAILATLPSSSPPSMFQHANLKSEGR